MNTPATATAQDQEDAEFDQHFSEAAADAGPSDAGQPAAAVDNAPAPQAGAERDTGTADSGRQQGQREAPPTLDELQRKFDETLARERANAGRLSVMARENNALREQLARLAASQQAAPAPAANPATQTPAAGSDADDDTEDALREAPDLRRSVDRLIAKRTSDLEAKLQQATQALENMGRQVQETQQTVQPLREREHQELIAATHRTLDERFGQKWREEVVSERYASWLQRQPEQIRHLAQHGARPEEAEPVLRLYFAAHGLQPQPPTQPEQQATQAIRPSAPRPAATPSDRLRLASGIPSRPASSRAAGPADDDFDAHFASAFRAEA